MQNRRRQMQQGPKPIMAVSIELLQRFPILANISDNSLATLAERSMLRAIARRGIVINGGQQEESLCFLFEGKLQGVDFTLDGREVGLYFVEPGNFCGELGLFDAQGQPESVIALTRSQVVFIPTQAFRDALQQNPSLVEPLFNRMSERVRQLSAQRALLGVPSTSGRVCGQLWMILQAQTSSQPSHIKAVSETQSVILNPPTHQELGIMLNLSRESVTRVFQTLQSKKIVQRDGNSRLIILDPETLQTLAENSD